MRAVSTLARGAGLASSTTSMAIGERGGRCACSPYCGRQGEGASKLVAVQMELGGLERHVHQMARSLLHRALRACRTEFVPGVMWIES